MLGKKYASLMTFMHFEIYFKQKKSGQAMPGALGDGDLCCHIFCKGIRSYWNILFYYFFCILHLVTFFYFNTNIPHFHCMR